MNYDINNPDIKEILDALNYCIFDDDLDYTNDSFYDNIVSIFKQHYHKPFKADNGCSKGVLIFEQLGFVIKIPFNFCDGYELCAVTEGDSEWDYCSQEANRYKMAVDAEVEEAFLPTYYLTSIVILFIFNLMQKYLKVYLLKSIMKKVIIVQKKIEKY